MRHFAGTHARLTLAHCGHYVTRASQALIEIECHHPVTTRPTNPNNIHLYTHIVMICGVVVMNPSSESMRVFVTRVHIYAPRVMRAFPLETIAVNPFAGLSCLAPYRPASGLRFRSPIRSLAVRPKANNRRPAARLPPFTQYIL